MNILVLDDDLELLSVTKSMLSSLGHTAETTDSPKDAIPLVESGDFDYVLVDYKMPENDGVWFMMNVKLPANTRALLITAYINRDAINRMFELGASGYIIKPFGQEDLARHLQFFSK